MTKKLFIPFTMSTIMAGLWAGCPSGDYDLGHIIVEPSGRGGSSQTGGTAGTLGVGGSPGTGGNGAAGGNAGKVVTFNNGQAQGAMTGAGWVALGTETTLTDPTCGTDMHPIVTDSALCTTTVNWSAANALCISGSIAALPPVPTQADYANNWGVEVAASSTAPTGGGLGQSFSTISLTFTGTPITGVRAEVHRKGDPDATLYCAYVTSGTAVPLTSFSTECWAATGPTLTAADVPNIDKIALQISSSFTAIAVQDFCMTRIEFGN